MKNLTTIFMFLCAISLPAQTINLEGRTIRAVVIGISEYQDPSITDLFYAHRDAEAFAEYLRSPAGGVTHENIQLLTNNKATAGNIITAFTWLVEESKSGDKCIISFSGHCDLEYVTKSQWGYLLAYDAPAKLYPAGGTISLPYLQEIVSTLSATGIEVVIISDACHTGKLAGSQFGGSQAVNNLLSQPFAESEIKIMSCQADEFSIESKDWGGGRGCFSYHLLNALIGDADQNNDGQVNLLEIGHYLEDNVNKSAAPHNQNPLIVGNRKIVISTVHRPTLESLRHSEKQNTAFSSTSTKGMETSIFTKDDSTLLRLYQEFVVALEDGNLLPISNMGTKSANELYLQLIHEPKLAKLHGSMTRNLAAGLQNEAQGIINKVIATDPQIIDDAFSPVAKYDHIPAYLARAAELLGNQHYMWRFLKAREYYFRSKTMRQENYPNLTPDSLRTLAIAQLDTAINLDSTSAHFFFDIGYLLYWSSWNEDPLPYFRQAAMLAPDWILPQYYIGRTYNFIGSKQKSFEILNTALSIDSSFLPLYRELALSAPTEEEKNAWFRKYVDKVEEYERNHPNQLPLTYINYLGNSLWFLGEFEKAKQVLLKGVEISNGSFPLFFANLGAVHCDLGEYELAEQSALKFIELSPLSFEGYSQLVCYRQYFTKKNMESIPGLFQKTHKIGISYPHDNLVHYYIQKNKIDSAILSARHWFNIDSSNMLAALRLAQSLKLGGQQSEALKYFKLLSNISENHDYVGKNPPFHYFQIFNMVETSHLDKLKHYLASAATKSTDLGTFYFWAACAFAKCNLPSDALAQLKKALESGWSPKRALWILPTLFNPDLDSVRLTTRFKRMIKKHLPEYAHKHKRLFNP